jgi:catechol 2,3-dioxygenase-like lactoylglutathione lyase family enzyme
MAPELVGLHHIRLSVSNVLASRDWYAEVLGLSPILVEEQEETVDGAVLEHPSGVVIGLHHDPDGAAALRDHALIGLAVLDLAAWRDHLDQLHVAHGPIVDAHVGRCLSLRDPDGILLELHTLAQPSVDET